MAEPFEYAIKKDVRNNPIVREVDEARQRELWRSVGIGCFLVIVLLFSGWQRIELTRHGYAIQDLQKKKAELEEKGRHLRLDIEAERSLQDIERRATQELRLVAPAHDEAFVIERVRPAEPPASSVVARR